MIVLSEMTRKKEKSGSLFGSAQGKQAPTPSVVYYIFSYIRKRRKVKKNLVVGPFPASDYQELWSIVSQMRTKSDLLGEIHPAQQVLKARVRAERIDS